MNATAYLNDVYKVLDERRAAAKAALSCFSPQCGYYNGHYYKNNDGKYEIAYYPIPVVEIRGLCDAEINLDDITVSTKLEKKRIPSFDFSTFENIHFECSGVDDYLADIYDSDRPIRELAENVKDFPENVISFVFTLQKNDTEGLAKLVATLKHNGFFY